MSEEKQLTSDEIVDEAGILLKSMKTSGRFTQAEVGMILDTAKMVHIQDLMLTMQANK